MLKVLNAKANRHMLRRDISAHSRVKLAILLP